METDVNTDQVVTDTGVVEPAPTTESVNSEVATEPEAGGQPTETEVLADGTTADKPVDYSRFKEVNEDRKAKEARIAELERYIAMQGQQPQEPKQPESLTLQVMRELNIDPEDIITGEQQAKITDEVTRRITAINESRFGIQSFISSKPDYAQVVGTTDPVTNQFVVAQPLLRAEQQNPGLLNALAKAGQAAPDAVPILAYHIAMSDPILQAERAKANKPPALQVSEQAAKAIQQANTITSVSAVAGTGSIDKAAEIRGMSDAEFEVYKQRVMSQSGVAP